MEYLKRIADDLLKLRLEAFGAVQIKVLPFSLSIFCTRVTPRLWFYPTSWAKEGCFRRNEFQLSLVLLPQKHEVKRLKNTK